MPKFNTTESSETNAVGNTTDPTISPIFFEETSVDIYKSGQTFAVPGNQTADWIVNITLALRSATAFDSPVLTLSFPELNLTSEDVSLPALSGNPNETIWTSVNWSISDGIPERWYPHNLGTPKLYNLTASIALAKNSSTSPVNFTLTTGFRTIQLVQSAYTQEDIERRGITPGDNWHFEINGKAFYSLGTNIIPFDPFYARTSTEQVRWVLESAVLSGQNMVSIMLFQICVG